MKPNFVVYIMLHLFALDLGISLVEFLVISINCFIMFD